MSYFWRVRLSYIFFSAVLFFAFALAFSWGFAVASVVPDDTRVATLDQKFQALETSSSSSPTFRADDPHPSTEAIDARSAGAFADDRAALGPDKKSSPDALLGNVDTRRTDMVAALPPVDSATPVWTGKNPRIAVIIDDMGLAVRNSEAIVDLPGALTLSYLPYATNIQGQVDRARETGHEIMLHLPMEPMKSDLSAGPNAIVTGLTPDELRRRLDVNLNAFSGYVGINNHMGSRGTSTPDVIEPVMKNIATRDVYFVDSWTSPRSVAYRMAADMNVPRARRDVFLDHEPGVAPVWQALRQAERMARAHGSAVVIGHPRADTIDVLRAWLPMARARGVQIVPMSTLIYSGDTAGDPVLIADAMRHRSARAEGSGLSQKYDN